MRGVILITFTLYMTSHLFGLLPSYYCFFYAANVKENFRYQEKCQT